MPPVSLSVGAARTLTAGRIPHVLGDPERTPEGERAWRRSLVATALRALQEPVAEPTVFDAAGPDKAADGIVGGVGPYGMAAVVVGLAVCVVIGFTMRQKAEA